MLRMYQDKLAILEADARLSRWCRSARSRKAVRVRGSEAIRDDVEIK
jgi:hypothetical protein